MSKKLKPVFGISLFFVVLVCMIMMSGFMSKAGTKAAQQPVYKYYTSVEIEKGDTLIGIAEQYMGTEYTDVDDYVDEVMSVNGLTSTTIHAGAYLTVPYYSSEVLN